MKTVTILSLGALGALFALPAEALTISNMDADSHTITVTVNGDSKELTVEPQAEVDAPCDKGCTVGLDSGEQYELKGDESASIEDGTLFVDSVPSDEADDGTEAGAGDKAEGPADNGAGSQAQ
jgi:hypothetical protein